MTLYFKNFVQIFKLSMTPPSIIYPIPLFAVVLYSLSNCRNVSLLFVAIAFTFISQAGMNLWNHVNDVEEDIIAGKVNVLTKNPELKPFVAVLSFLLYSTAFLILISFSKDKRALIACILVFVATWLYSDRLLIGRFFKRLKDHYLTEVVTYAVSAPAFTLATWSIYGELCPKAFAVAIIMSFFALSGTFLKDLKDASGDEKAGLKTLAVAFSPLSLLLTSVLMLWLYYTSIILFTLLGLIPLNSALAVLPSILLAYSTYVFLSEREVSFKVLKPIKLMIFSSVSSLAFLAIANLLPLL